MPKQDVETRYDQRISLSTYTKKEANNSIGYNCARIKVDIVSINTTTSLKVMSCLNLLLT